MAQQNNESIKVGRDETKMWRERLEEIEEAIVREAQGYAAKGEHALAEPRQDTADRLGAALDVQEQIDEALFRSILRSEAADYTDIQINTEVTLVRCRLADVPEAWDMGGQASTKLPLQAAA
jgi:hypothetical protein